MSDAPTAGRVATNQSFITFPIDIAGIEAPFKYAVQVNHCRGCQMLIAAAYFKLRLIYFVLH